eukprot:556878-Rhodomonas_salina.5
MPICPAAADVVSGVRVVRREAICWLVDLCERTEGAHCDAKAKDSDGYDANAFSVVARSLEEVLGFGCRSSVHISFGQELKVNRVVGRQRSSRSLTELLAIGEDVRQRLRVVGHGGDTSVRIVLCTHCFYRSKQCRRLRCAQSL